MKYEVVWFVGKFCYTKTLALAENKLELREYGTEPSTVPLNTDSDVYYAVYARTTLSDMAAGIKPRSSLKEMLDTRRILDAMNAKTR